MRMIVLTTVMSLALVLASWLSGYTQQPAALPLGQLPPAQPGLVQSGMLQAGPPSHAGQPGGDTQVLSTVFSTGNTTVQQIVVIDSRQQSMAVYHVSAASGKIELKSVRKIGLDMALEQFNAVEPLPSDMRLLRQ